MRPGLGSANSGHILFYGGGPRSGPFPEIQGNNFSSGNLVDVGFEAAPVADTLE